MPPRQEVLFAKQYAVYLAMNFRVFLVYQNCEKYTRGLLFWLILRFSFQFWFL